MKNFSVESAVCVNLNAAFIDKRLQKLLRHGIKSARAMQVAFFAVPNKSCISKLRFQLNEIH